MTTRQNTPKAAKLAPTNSNGWNLLLSQAIRRAEARGDVRLASLKSAMRDGKAESVLRRYGIISDGDLKREFPE